LILAQRELKIQEKSMIFFLFFGVIFYWILLDFSLCFVLGFAP